LIVGWSGRFLFFVVPRLFSQDFGEWPENQILIPDWTYFHCPGATLLNHRKQFFSLFLYSAFSLRQRHNEWNQPCPGSQPQVPKEIGNVHSQLWEIKGMARS